MYIVYSVQDTSNHSLYWHEMIIWAYPYLTDCGKVLITWDLKMGVYLKNTMLKVSCYTLEGGNNTKAVELPLPRFHGNEGSSFKTKDAKK